MELSYKQITDGNNALSIDASILAEVRKLPPMKQKLFWMQELDRRKKEERLRYFEPNDNQAYALKDEVSEKFIFGGNRGGKTVYGIIETIVFALGKEKIKMYNQELYDLIKDRKIPDDPKTIWVASEDKKVLKSIILKEFLKWMPKTEIKRQFHREDANIILKDDTVIYFKSYDSGREKFQGDKVHYMWFDEEPPEEIYEEGQMRLLDYDGTSLCTMTPVLGLTWVFSEIYEKQDQLPNLSCHNFLTEDNKHLPKERLEQLKKKYADDPELLAVRLRGEFLQMTGLIYKRFKKHLHVIDELDPLKINHDNTFYIGIDPGIAHPTGVVFAMVDEDETLIVFDELCENNLEVSYQAEKIKDKISMWGIDPYWIVIDPAARNRNPETLHSILDNYNDNGIYPILGNNDRKAGIIQVSEYLKPRENIKSPKFPDGKPQLLICKNCVNLIREFRNYRWMEYKLVKNTKDRKDRPVKIMDDELDALRYVVMNNPIHLKKELILYKYKANNKKTGY